MSKLRAQGRDQNKPFKSTFYQGKRRRQTRNYYTQGNYQNKYRSNSGDRRMSFGGRAQYGQNYRGRSQYVKMTLGEEILEECKIIEVKILEVDVEVAIEMTTLEEGEVDLVLCNIK